METEYEIFLKETTDSACTRAHEFFNNRANTRMALGRHGEALRDYDRACGLEPDDPLLLIQPGRTLPGTRDERTRIGRS